MKLIMKKISVVLLFMALSLSSFAQLPDLPSPLRLVNDYAKKLSQSENDQLEQKLVALDKSTSVQICVVIINTLGEYGIDQFGDELAMKWHIGAKGKDNGVLIVVKPKTLESKGEARISVGYGLEAVIPDATAGQIVDYDMIPQFKQENYYAGIDGAVNSITKFASGEFTPSSYKKKHEKSSSLLFLFPIFALIFIYFLMRLSSRKKGTNIGSNGSNNNSLLWILAMLFMNSGGGRGGFGGGSSDSGFGGFGGGDFGGGGASGSW